MQNLSYFCQSRFQTNEILVELAIEEIEGDFLGSEFPLQVTIPTNQTEVQYLVPTIDDELVEQTGEISVQLLPELAISSRNSPPIMLVQWLFWIMTQCDYPLVGNSPITEGDEAEFTISSQSIATQTSYR